MRAHAPKEGPVAERFTELEREVWRGFLETSSWVLSRVEDDLRVNARLSHVEYEVLLRLTRHPEHRQRIQDLASRSLLTRSGMSRAVDRLAAGGLVQREEAPEDRRGAYAVLTAAGAQRFESAREFHVDLLRRVFLSRFTDEEQRALAGFWSRFSASPGSDTGKAPL